jgi:arginyl-tRNA synthetase
MKATLQKLITAAIHKLREQENLTFSDSLSVNIEHSKDKKHGDYATNVALALAKQAGLAPRALAQKIIDNLDDASYLESTAIAGPGFINFFIAETAKAEVISTILKETDTFGQTTLADKKKIIVEYVSANPTGPLHVGHGRSAAFGASLVNLLRHQGYDVHAEYYVNDAGRQMNILAVSVWLRYLESLEHAFPFPQNGYKGDYVQTIAQHLSKEVDSQYDTDTETFFSDLPHDAPEGDKEIYIDALISKARQTIGEEGFKHIHQYGLNDVLKGIQDDLGEFRVNFDKWFSEENLMTSGAIEKGIEALQNGDFLYEKEGATWFKSTNFGDEKDRVLKRANGVSTYFASDVAYLWNKSDRGFDESIYIFGADHHGYVARLKAAAHALGFTDTEISFLLVQFAILYRGEDRVQMSTRSGEFVTLKTLYDEVGVDATRFFYIMRKSSQHMDFDLELAKSRSNENPVYYIQYAHARIASVFRALADKGLEYDESLGLKSLDTLTDAHEQTLMNTLSRFPVMLKGAAKQKEPHQIAYFCRELANQLHTYYNAKQFIVDDEKKRNARLALIKAVKQVLKNGLQLIGVSTPETM